MTDENVQIRLASRPDGLPGPGNFTITPEAFIGMLQGKNFGKLLVRVS